jgi:alpha,alpha-trehalase
MTVWSLEYEGFDPESEGHREALCTLGNGVFATRGAAPEATADGVHYPGTYVAGLYNRRSSEVADRTVENEDLVNVPNWLPLTFRADGGDWFAPGTHELVWQTLHLDLQQGVLVRRAEVVDAEGRTTRLAQRRLVSMDDAHVAALETTLEPVDWSGTLTLRSGLDGTVTNGGVERYRSLESRHLEVLDTGEDGEVLHLVTETNQSRVRVALAARTRLGGDTDAPEQDRRTVADGGWIAHEIDVAADAGVPVTVEKVVTLRTGRDRAVSEPGLHARETVAGLPGFDDLLDRHALAWEHLWRRFSIHLEDGNRSQLILNLHLFHLLQTTSEHTLDLDVGVPARGWHGEAYRGHVFWDEVFILPFVSLRLPALTRALLHYRRRRLEAARRHAREEGHVGALYPWQSGSDGREESQRLHLNPMSGRWHPDNSSRQRHINLAVAYNMWMYFEVTGDIEYLRFHAGKVILEIARFFSSLATYDRIRDRFVIRGVMGPDEYHDAYPDAEEPGLDNNAYTNVLTVWVLRRALELLETLPEQHRHELTEELGLEEVELERWQHMTRRMYVPFHDGIISQFEGYERLERLDLEAYRRRYGDIHRMDRILKAEDDTPNRYQVSKQADVLMLFYLLPDEEVQWILAELGYDFDPATDVARNAEYYLERTVHGSTLSGVVTAWVLSRIDRPASWEHFRAALEADVSDVQGGTTAEGIHLGAMAGTVDLAQRCYAGIVTRGGRLWFHPVLPDALAGLRFTLHYRQHRLAVEITHERLRIAAAPALAAPITVGCQTQAVTLEAGSSMTWELEPPGTGSRS